MTKIAYFCEPQVGGTFSFFRRIRAPLLERGIDFRCIPPVSAERLEGTQWASIDGIDAVQFPETDLSKASEILMGYLQGEKYDAVMVLPGSDTLCVNLIRYLPRAIRAIARIPMFTRGSYAPATAISAHLDKMIAVCHRIADDMIGRYKISPSKVEVIYNGIEIPAVDRKHGSALEGPLQIVFTGRLVDSHKGITLLPVILRRLIDLGVEAKLTVVGDGPDAPLLQQAINTQGVTQQMNVVGQVDLLSVQKYLANAHAYLLPTRYEGCPNSLLEAMAHGCAPVVSRLRGSTDYIIEDGVSGLLADPENADSFVRHLFYLANDRSDCYRVGLAAQERIRELFQISHTADLYAETIRRVVSAPDQRPQPLPLHDYNVPRSMRPSWRTWIPDPMKIFLRVWLEKMGISC